jgi:hypothetical protein
MDTDPDPVPDTDPDPVPDPNLTPFFKDAKNIFFSSYF